MMAHSRSIINTKRRNKTRYYAAIAALLFFAVQANGQSCANYIITTIAGTGTAGYSGDGGAATAANLYNPFGVATDGSGNVYIADQSNNCIRKISTSGVITTIAGTGTAGYSGDGGAATAANLYSPQGVATDGSGNVYIADWGNNRIRKVSTSGVITTIAGTGTGGYSGDGGAATAANLYYPTGVATDGSGNVYIADYNNNRIRKISTSGVIATIAGTGTGGYSGDGGAATAANLNAPLGVATDGSGNVYIADYVNHRIRKISTSGIITTIAGTGTLGYSGDGGAATAAKLNYPYGVATDGSGNVYIADYFNNRIRKVSTSGVITTIAGTGTAGYSGDGGAATAANLNRPTGVATDGSGNVYIADRYNHRIRKMFPSLPATTGASSVCVGGATTLTNSVTGGTWSSSDNSLASVSTAGVVSGVSAGAPTITYLFTSSCGISIATKAITVNAIPVLTVTPVSAAICAGGSTAITASGASTYNWSPATGLSASTGATVTCTVGTTTTYTVTGTSAVGCTNTATQTITVNAIPVLTVTPVSAAICISGSTAITASGAATYTWSPATGLSASTGATVTFTRTTTSTYTVTGTSAAGCTATTTQTITVDPQRATGYIITTIAGTGTGGYSGDGGAATAANLYSPFGAAIDGSGNVYIADQSNNRIRKISTSGVITTIAGTGTAGYSGDGGAATAANLYYPAGVATDGSGNVYIADQINNRIRKISTSGVITTIAGTGTAGYSGDGGAATAANLYNPTGVATDGSGNVYIADVFNYCIRKVSTSGIITTIAGTGTAGYSGDGGAATAANLYLPYGVATDGSGNVYIADYNNNRIRKVSISGIITTIAGTGTAGYSGDGGAATAANLRGPSGVATDGSGNVYIADTDNDRIRKVSTSGVITSIAGTGTAGYSGDGGAATAATLYLPTGVATDGSGNVYIADFFNNRIRKMFPSLPATTGASSVCVGGAITLANSVTGGTWSSSDNSLASVSTAGVVSGVSAGAPTITYSYTNACGTAIAPKGIAVNAIPVLTVTPVSAAICAGGSTAITASGAATYTWSPATGLSASTGATVTCTVGTTTTYTVTGTSAAGCTGTSTQTITVNAVPVLTVTPVAATICNGGSTAITASGAATYTWSPATGLSASIGATVTCTATTTTTYTITGTSAAGCTATTTRTITVNALPTVVITPVSAAICAGGSTAITASGASTYNWSPATGLSASIGATVTCNVGSTTTYTVTGTSAVGCTNTATQTITVNAIPVLTVTPVAATICISGSTAITASGAATYTWSPATGLSASTGATVTFTGTTTTTYTVTGTSAAGCTGTSTQTITVDPQRATGYIITTLAGTGTFGYSGDGGAATAANLYYPYGVATDGSGNVYIAEYFNNRIRKISTSGVITTIAGTGAGSYSGDGGAATAANLYYPFGAAVDGSGNVYIADRNNQRIRKISTSGIITTIAGTGTAGYSGDGGAATAANLYSPYGVATDGSGNVYIADYNNHRIRKISTSGIITTIAGTGTGGYSGDGGAATAANLYNPTGVAVDGSGNVYIADNVNNRIRKISTSGVITTIAGTGTAGYSGDGGAATAANLFLPQGVATDANGNVYIADRSNNRIRKISTSGIIMTISGTGTGVYSGDGGAATAANLNQPPGVATDGSGNVYIADQGNHRIRKMFPSLPATTGASSVCVGGATTLANSVTGGTWSSSDNSLASVSTAGVVSGVSAGAPTITYSYTNACGTAIAPKGIAVNAVPVLTVTPVSAAICAGGSTAITASGAATYTWSPATGLSASTGATVTCTVGTTTTYTVTGTSAAGCAGTSTQTITVNAVPVLTVTPVAATICNGGSTAITASGAATYTWSPATGLSASIGATVTCTATTTTTYTITGTNAAGCTATTTRTITVNPLPTVVITPVSAAICAGGSTAITASGASTYNWSPATGLSASTGATVTCNVGSTTTYTVTGTSAAGCTNTATQTITVNAIPVLTVTPVSAAICISGSTAITASGAATYTWSPATGLSASTGATVTFTGTTTTTYTVTGTSAAGCTATTTQTITVDPQRATGYIITTIAGTGTFGYSGDGAAATAANLYNPTGVATDGSGNVYIADLYNHRIRKISTSGVITTIAGTGTFGYSGDGGAATAAKLYYPQGVATDGSGNVYIADVYNNRIRKISTSGVITTIAGTGTAGYSGDGGAATAANLYYPTGVATDGSGNVYIADYFNNRIRKISTSGIITTIAGTGTAGYSGDGGAATAAKLNDPTGVATDGSGNVYIADTDNNRIRKISTSGVITTIAGTGTLGYSGDGGAATAANLYSPTGVATDGSGNVYIADALNNRIRKISTSGVITTIAGTGTGGYSGDGGAATAANLYNPSGVATDGSGNVYIADLYNHRIRKMFPSLPATTGASSVCVGGAITLANSVTGGTWSSSDNSLASVSTAGVVSGVSAGAPTITYSFTNACGTAIAPKGIAVNAIPVLTVTPVSAAICAGGSTAITASGAATYSWSPATGLSASTGATVTCTVGTTTTYTVTGTSAAGCTGTSTQTITVDPQRATGYIITTLAGTGTGAGAAGYSGDGGAATAANLNGPYGVAIDGSGNVYIADRDNHRIRKISTSGVITTIAGTGTGGYSGDGGAATAANLSYPAGVATDGSGNVYIADRSNNRIRKVSTSGIITTVAGTGTAGYSGDGGAATAASLRAPSGVATDGSGNVYIADENNIRIRKISTSGIITTIAGTGTGGYSGDGGAATAANLSGTTGVATDGSGNVYIADRNNNRIRKISTSGVITTIAGTGTLGYSGDGGAATAANLYYPYGVATDGSGNVYISDQYNNRIRKVSITGVITTIAGTGTLGDGGDGGAATAANLSRPNGVATDGSGSVYIADNLNHRIRKMFPSLPATTGASSVCVGGAITLANSVTGGSWSSSDNSLASVSTAGVVSGVSAGAPTITYSYTNACGTAIAPTGIAVNAVPVLTVTPVSAAICAGGSTAITASGAATYTWSPATGLSASTGATVTFTGTTTTTYTVTGTSAAGCTATTTQTITVDPQRATGYIITTLAGTVTGGYSGDGGAATAANLNGPYGVAIDGSGNVYIADVYNHRIRKISTSGVITTIAGTGTGGYSGDGGAATAANLYYPAGVATDGSGNVYIADYYNHRIRKVSISGIITTIAGTGTGGYSGDGGAATAANLYYPYGVATDGSGNVYIADYSNNRIRKISTSGVITTIAGTGTLGYSGDGGAATAANLRGPSGVATDGSGNVYIADNGNHRIRKISTSGVITTIAGTGTASYSGDGGAATAANLSRPTGVATDGSGNVYIADYSNNRIRKISTSGLITTIAGTGTGGYSGDGGAATAAKLYYPTGVATDGSGNVYIADWNTQRIRKMFPSLPATTGASSVCVGGAITLTNSVTGGTWSSSDNSLASVSTAGVVSGVSAGAPTITYSYTNACGTAIAPTGIAVNAVPVLTVTPVSAAICAGGSTAITASGAATYSWSPATELSASTGATVTFTGTTTSTYTVTGTSAAGCTGTSTQTITVNAVPVLTVTPVAATICAGGSTAITSGGASTYSWSPSTGLSASTGATVTCSVGSTTTYTVTGTSSGGCTSTSTSTITVNTIPTVTATSVNATICTGSATAITASGATTYSWSPATGLSAATGATVTCNATSTTTYTITGTNGSGCTGTTTKTITVAPAVHAGIASAVAPCSGYATNIIFTGTVGDTISYSIDGGAYSNAVFTGSTYTLYTGTLSASHTYLLHNVKNAACTLTIDTAVTVSPTAMTWIGVADTNWSNTANWSCGTIPSVTDDVFMPSGATYLPAIAASAIANVRDLNMSAGVTVKANAGSVINIKGNLSINGTFTGTGIVKLSGTTAQAISGTGIVNSLELNNTAGATISSASKLTVTNKLTITAGTLATGDSLVLYSDSARTALVTPIPASGAVITGAVKLMQYIPGGLRRFRFVAHPFSGYTGLSQLGNYIDITGTGGSANGFTNTASNAPSAFRYDPTVGNDSLAYDPGWRPFTSTATSADSNRLHRYQGIRLYFRGMKGEGLSYGTYTPSATTIAQTGTLNQGTQYVTMVKGSISHQDYNMIGNPYASPVDIGTVIHNAKVAGKVAGSAFYIWNPYLGAAGQFQAIAVNTVSASPYYIQSSFSFQVRAAHNGDTLTFTENNKGTVANVALLKTESENIGLTIYDENYHPWDMLQVKFSESASDKEDDEDATKPSGSDFNFYSKSANNSKLAIDARPFHEGNVIPLGINSNYMQDFIIKAENIALPEGKKLYLHDKLLKQYTLLQQGAEYKFSISADKGTQGENRFELTSVTPAMSQTEHDGLQVNMVPNPATDVVTINYINTQKESLSVRIVDLAGACVYNNNIGSFERGSIAVRLSKYAAGIYMVEIVSGSQKIVQKLVKE